MDSSEKKKKQSSQTGREDCLEWSQKDKAMSTYIRLLRGVNGGEEGKGKRVKQNEWGTTKETNSSVETGG